MAEDVHHDSGRHALHQQEGRARVSKVVEPTLWQPGSIEQSMEFLGDGGPIERRPNRSREDELGVYPSLACISAFLLLTREVLAEGFGDHGWHGERAPAALRLWLDQAERTVEALQLFGDAEVAHLQVDVRPGQS